MPQPEHFTFSVFFRDGRIVEVEADWMDEYLGGEDKTIAFYKGNGPDDKFKMHVATFVKSQIIGAACGPLKLITREAMFATNTFAQLPEVAPNRLVTLPNDYEIVEMKAEATRRSSAIPVCIDDHGNIVAKIHADTPITTHAE